MSRSMTKMPRLFTAFLLMAPTLGFSADLKVEISDAKFGSGEINVGLFSNAASFPKSPVVGQRVAAVDGKAVAIFRNLAPGMYALSAFLDENANGALDRNVLGMPTERYGFSRDALGTMGPPNFDVAQFKFESEDQTQKIQLR